MTVGDTVESMKYLFKVFECRLTRSSYARFAPGVSSTRTLTAYAKNASTAKSAPRMSTIRRRAVGRPAFRRGPITCENTSYGLTYR